MPRLPEYTPGGLTTENRRNHHVRFPEKNLTMYRAGDIVESVINGQRRYLRHYHRTSADGRIPRYTPPNWKVGDSINYPWKAAPHEGVVEQVVNFGPDADKYPGVLYVINPREQEQ